MTKLADTRSLCTQLDVEDTGGRPLWATRVDGALPIPGEGSELVLPNRDRLYVVTGLRFIYKYPPAEGWLVCHVVVTVAEWVGEGQGE